MRIAIIDADSMIWVTAYHHREQEVFNPLALDQAIKDIFQEVGATHYLGFLGTPGDHTFRNEIYPEYKGQRPSKPEFMEKWEQSIREYLVNVWKFQEVKGIEADDAVSICHRFGWDGKSILCSPDKDLKQVPGEFYDFGKKIGGYISVEDAEKNLWTQVLTGDAADGIKGLPGIGPKKAEKIIEAAYHTPYPEAVLSEYTKALGEHKGIEEFYKNYTLVKMLESHPDFVIPTPNKV